MIEQQQAFVRQRQRELVGEAERERMAQAVRRAQGNHSRWHRKALTALGYRLVVWGEQLQKRYGEVYLVAERVRYEQG